MSKDLYASHPHPPLVSSASQPILSRHRTDETSRYAPSYPSQPSSHRRQPSSSSTISNYKREPERVLPRGETYSDLKSHTHSQSRHSTRVSPGQSLRTEVPTYSHVSRSRSQPPRSRRSQMSDPGDFAAFHITEPPKDIPSHDGLETDTDLDSRVRIKSKQQKHPAQIISFQCKDLPRSENHKERYVSVTLIDLKTQALVMQTEWNGELENPIFEIGRAVQQECRDRSRMPSSA
eukprot:TRINITY_DN3344_c0_g1_i1.p1 TRINITY_DN3344_c0_g1~~TRINITY_DN3344_c0_g1_i1.p1  ORF type:complete len:234 (-),score=1.50 TRINITY_DN3344_c0_g1_i1:11-712(-)